MNFFRSPGLFLLPTYGRPHLLSRFFERYEKTRARAPGVVILAADDPCIFSYRYYTALPHGWEFYVQETTEQEPIRCFAASLRGWMDKYFYFGQNAFEWLGFLTDDHYPVSVEWDREIVEALHDNVHVVSSNDLWKAPYRMAGVQVHTAEILKAVGYLFPPGFKHLFVDDVWEAIGRATGTWDIKMDVVVKHIHYLNEGAKAEKDEVYQESEGFYAHDGALFKEWMAKDFSGVVDRVRGILK